MKEIEKRDKRKEKEKKREERRKQFEDKSDEYKLQPCSSLLTTQYQQ